MNLVFVLGTAAELIKVYPLLHEAQARRAGWVVVHTGQNGENFHRQVADFGLPPERIVRALEHTRDLAHALTALGWFCRCLVGGFSAFRGALRKLRAPGGKTYVIVHGDTLSTVVGSLWARAARAELVHVEAGMRSRSWRSPFPEELNRRLVSRLAQRHMASDAQAAANLAREGITRGVVITNGNTVVDALRLVVNPARSPGGYALANIHRFENLQSESRWRHIVELIARQARQRRLVFILMPATRARLAADVWATRLLRDAGVELRDRLPFREFALLLDGAEYVISDSGSNQQECHHLGRPCLIMRDRTESIEGLADGTCVLASFDDGIIDRFLANPAAHICPRSFPATRPTDLIFRELAP